MLDFSQLEKIATPQDLEAQRIRQQAIQYLQSTDWYVIRQIEVGALIPDNIKAARTKARANIASLTAVSSG